ncbi:MAG: zinc ABC transporter substrate-binding protein, partial [Planctomycetota bacterium]
MHRFLLLFAALAAVSLGGCSGEPASDTADQGGGLNVLATSGPVGDAVVHVLGEHGAVEVMMGPGIDPHLYREKPADLRKLSDADVVFYNGLHFEGIHDTLDKLAEKQPVFAVSATLEAEKDKRLRYPDGFEALPDPHIWHDASVWADCVDEIATRLGEVDPDHASDYRAAADAYKAELASLHEWCKTQMASVPESQRLMVTAHDAFGYFSDGYGIETVGLKGVSTEDEIDLGR